MASIFEGLQPERVWHHFEAITRLPHGSGNEDAVRRYIADFAVKMGFEHFYNSDAPSDAPGDRTVVIYKKAAPGLEHQPTVVLQAHMDMVCVPHDQIFPLRLLSCDSQGGPGAGWVKAGGYSAADGTSLGADDGIGVALALAILEENRYPLGPLEALFTVQEETGLIGAREFDPDLIRGRILINLDEEDVKKITYGCAGGIDSIFRYTVGRETVPSHCRYGEVSISGLKGGHSGMAIHEGGANAIRLLTRILNRAWHEKIGYHLADIHGGRIGQTNVIPSQAFAGVVLAEADLKRFEALVADMDAAFRQEYQPAEPGLQVHWRQLDPPAEMLDREGTAWIGRILMALPHGVQKMTAVGNAVETSTNLAVVAVNGKEVTVICKHRSSRESGLNWMADLHRALAAGAGAAYSQGERYPVWTPDEASDLLRKARSVYEAQFKGDYEATVIHAGLECDWVVEKYKHGPPMDCIAVGPTLLEPHTVRERLEIASVAAIYSVVLQILQLYAH